MRKLLPTGLFGAFCLLLFLAMLSTDDSRIFSATLTIAQDCILPFFPKGLSPEKHVRMIRMVAIGIGIFFAFGSHFMEQLDYINLFVTLACSMWLTGCAPIMVFGLYWKKGTTAAAWSSLLSGMFLSIVYIFTQRNWAEIVYPMLQKLHLVNFTDTALQILSSPFGTWIEWKMDAVKCPVNPVEFSFFASMFTLLLYVVVSLCTCKEDFNMDRMLHRGEYADPNEHKNLKLNWSPRHIFKNLIGITPEYSRGDRLIAYGIFLHSFVYGFVILFIGTVIWNAITPWKIEYWSRYFFITNLAVPGVIAVISAFWFGIGGTIDMFRLFRDLEKRPTLNVLDDGRVEGNVSLADKKSDTTK